MKFKFACIAIIFGSFACAAAMAEDSKPPTLDLTQQTADSFQVQIDQVQRDMQKGGRFEYITEDERAAVQDGLKFMHDLIQQNGTVAAMKEEDRIRLFNRQERVNALLTKNDSQRIVCAKAGQTGSLFKSTTCHTVAELEKRKRESDAMLERTRMNQTSFRGIGGPGGQ